MVRPSPFFTRRENFMKMELRAVITTLGRISSDLTIFCDGRDIPEDTLDAFIVSLEFCYRELIILDTLHQLNNAQREGITHASLRALFDAKRDAMWNCQIPILCSGAPPR